MKDIDWNKIVWERDYDWSGLGEEWSSAWGSSEAQWFGCILPRIRQFLPAHSILEIAPGHGRWTRFLTKMSSIYSGVDVSATCVEYCEDAFPGSHCSFFLNDGFDLSMIADGTIDFAFSFDSLVHAEKEVMESYVSQLFNKCRVGGAVFLHHSNLRALEVVPTADHCRASTVDATLVSEIIRRVGGTLLRQEIICWGGVDCLDCLTLFGRGDDWGTSGEIVVNNDFMKEAEYIRAQIAPWGLHRKKV